MFHDHAGRALFATGVATTFASDAVVRFASSPNLIPACNLIGAILAALYAAWSARRARVGSKAPAPSPATVAAVMEVLTQVAAGYARASTPTPPSTPTPTAPLDDEPEPATPPAFRLVVPDRGPDFPA